MNVPDRIVTLQTKHTELEEALNAENGRPLPDPAVITDLKKRKLRIKDEIAALDSH